MQADVLKLDLVGQSRLERLIDEHSGLALKFLFRSWPVSTNVHLQEAIDARTTYCLLCGASPLRVRKKTRMHRMKHPSPKQITFGYGL
jgi:hypothetical protein